MSTPFVPVQVVVKGRAYTYKTPVLDLDSQGLDALVAVLHPLDRVVVPWGATDFTVGVVESVNVVPLDPQAKFEYKWIVQRIDFMEYEALVAEGKVPA